MLQAFQIREEHSVAISCNVLKRPRYDNYSVWKSKTPPRFLWKQKYPSKNSHGLLQEINTKSEKERFLYFHEVLFPFCSCHKLSTTRCRCEVCRGRPLWSLRVLICVLWKIRHFVSTCQRWLHNRSFHSENRSFLYLSNGNMSLLLLLWVHSLLFLLQEP